MRAQAVAARGSVGSIEARRPGSVAGPALPKLSSGVRADDPDDQIDQEGDKGDLEREDREIARLRDANVRVAVLYTGFLDNRKELGFDPTARSHELDASSRTAKRSPKRVLERLTGGQEEREARCWTEPALDHLGERGQDNGLAAFLGEVEEHLVPVLSESAPPLSRPA